MTRSYRETHTSHVNGGRAKADRDARCEGSGMPLISGACSVCHQQIGTQGKSTVLAAMHRRPAWMQRREEA